MAIIIPRMVPRNIVREEKPERDMQMGQLSMTEQVSTAFWLTVRITSNGEAAEMASELYSAPSACRQVLKQLQVGFLAIGLDMYTLGTGTSPEGDWE